MNWSTPATLKAQLSRYWERGELLREDPADAPRFPLRLTLKAPSSSELGDAFERVRTWVAELSAVPYLRLEWREFRHRLHGRQSLPEAAWLDDRAAALAWLGKSADAARFARLRALTTAQQPALLPWLEKRPLQALALAEQWPALLAVVRWLQAHPRPGLYLRQVDIPGVHSKFIEAHRAVLAELLDQALPEAAIAMEQTGTARFAARYGFLDKPLRLRFRLLDPSIALLPGGGLPDVTLDADSFARLDLPVGQVFITENETNFLAFPATPAAIVLFGAGYGWEALSRADWLDTRQIHYWGDIDTHGFAILDQLRLRFPQAASLLMDRETLLRHRDYWGQETEPLTRDLTRLTTAEREVFDALRDDLLGHRVRLEQEHLGFEWVARRIGRIAAPAT